MRRGGRIIFRSVMLGSVALCVVMAVLWVRSYWFATGVTFPGGRWDYDLGVYKGDIGVSENGLWHGPQRWRVADWRIPEEVPPDRSMMVFPGVNRGGSPGWRYVDVWMGYPVMLLAMPAMVSLAVAWRRRRARL